MSKTLLKITVPAIPVGQPRMRAMSRGGHAKLYTPRLIKSSDGTKRIHPIHDFKATIKHVASGWFSGAPLRGPLRVDVICVFPRHSAKVWKSKPMPRYPHVQKPDRDNVDKAVLDALKGIVFADDCQVCAGSIEKWHAAGDEQPHVEIVVSEL